jgi:hypothetical protein
MPAAQSYLMSTVCVFASSEADYERLRELRVCTVYAVF